MVGMIVAIVLTFTLSLALLLLLLGGKSPVAARLTELAPANQVAPPAPSGIDVASRITSGLRRCARCLGWQTTLKWRRGWRQLDIAERSM